MCGPSAVVCEVPGWSGGCVSEVMCISFLDALFCICHTQGCSDAPSQPLWEEKCVFVCVRVSVVKIASNYCLTLRKRDWLLMLLPAAAAVAATHACCF